VIATASTAITTRRAATSTVTARSAGAAATIAAAWGRRIGARRGRITPAGRGIGARRRIASRRVRWLLCVTAGPVSRRTAPLRRRGRPRWNAIAAACTAVARPGRTITCRTGVR
jgi:hypothetical protein